MLSIPSSMSLHELLAIGKARRVFAALKRIGWRDDRTVGSHRVMKKAGWADFPFSFHDSEEFGPAILAKMAKRSGLQAPRPVTSPAITSPTGTSG